MKTILSLGFLAVLSLFITPVLSTAQINISGQWEAQLFDDNGVLVRTEKWTLKQRNIPELPDTDSVTGAGSSIDRTWTSSGAVQGTEFSKVDTFNIETYVVVFQGTIAPDSSSMSGEWGDNFEIQGFGTWTAVRTAPEQLAPGTVIEDAPVVEIANKNITVTMEKFDKALPKTAGAVLARATRQKLTVRYEVNVKGATRKQTRTKIVSKRNEVTIKKLVPGNYVSTYRVRAMKGDKVVYSSSVSPPAQFVIR